jgi:hypothetical protein
VKEEGSKVVELPFERKDYPNTNKSMFAIESAKGTNLSVLRNMVQMQAKVNLANAMKQILNSRTNQLQSGGDGQTISSFQQEAASIVDQSIEKIMLIDEKVLKMKDGNQYDYWGVYSMDIEDVARNINQKLGTEITPKDLNVSQSN